MLPKGRQRGGKSMDIRSIAPARWAAFLGTVAFLAVAPQVAFAQSAAGPEAKAVAVATTADPQVGGPWVIAREKGLLAAEGLSEGQIQIFPSGPAAFPVFASGGVQGMTSSEQAMLTQAAGGVPLKLVGVYSDLTGVHGMVGSAAIKSAKDLEGRSVGLQKGSTAEWYTRNLCKTFGCDITKVKILNMPPPEAVTALATGNIDAFAAWQPFLNRALEAGKDKGAHWVHYSNVSYLAGAEGPRKIHNAYGVLYFNPAFLEKNPRTVEAVLRALDKAINFIRTNKTEAVKILGAEFKQSDADMDKLVSSIKYELAISNDLVKDVQGAVDLLLGEKLIKEPIDVAKAVIAEAPLKNIKPAAMTFTR
ncbi:MAG: transporter substrate-binding domain-containing protein [Alphaproteobacteria bacterium]|nr:transporter substrate-binding domain-containing protein [Alphaproteobacteria bacterium]